MSLLRSAAFFDGADAGWHVAVLAGWTLAGAAALAGVAHRARRARAHANAFRRPLAAGSAR